MSYSHLLLIDQSESGYQKFTIKLQQFEKFRMDIIHDDCIKTLSGSQTISYRMERTNETQSLALPSPLCPCLGQLQSHDGWF
jgi:hypothetical protein